MTEFRENILQLCKSEDSNFVKTGIITAEYADTELHKSLIGLVKLIECYQQYLIQTHTTYTIKKGSDLVYRMVSLLLRERTFIRFDKNYFDKFIKGSNLLSIIKKELPLNIAEANHGWGWQAKIMIK